MPVIKVPHQNGSTALIETGKGGKGVVGNVGKGAKAPTKPPLERWMDPWVKAQENAGNVQEPLEDMVANFRKARALTQRTPQQAAKAISQFSNPNGSLRVPQHSFGTWVYILDEATLGDNPVTTGEMLSVLENREAYTMIVPESGEDLGTFREAVVCTAPSKEQVADYVNKNLDIPAVCAGYLHRADVSPEEKESFVNATFANNESRQLVVCQTLLRLEETDVDAIPEGLWASVLDVATNEDSNPVRQGLAVEGLVSPHAPPWVVSALMNPSVRFPSSQYEERVWSALANCNVPPSERGKVYEMGETPESIRLFALLAGNPATKLTPVELDYLRDVAERNPSSGLPSMLKRRE